MFGHLDLNPDTVNHPGTNRAPRRLTSLIGTNALYVKNTRCCCCFAVRELKRVVWSKGWLHCCILVGCITQFRLCRVQLKCTPGIQRNKLVSTRLIYRIISRPKLELEIMEREEVWEWCTVNFYYPSPCNILSVWLPSGAIFAAK